MTATFDVVVLAGGASRRMGHDKAVLDVGGRRLVDLVADHMASVADRVLVARGARPLGRDDEVEDVAGCTGPLGGVLAGLRASSADLVGVVPVDAPDTGAHVMRRLAMLCASHHRAAAVAVADGHLQALHVVVARGAVQAVGERVAAGERSPRRLWGWIDALRVDADGWGDLDPIGALARDWDRPRDLPAGVQPG